jgi:hypothetical protein
VNFQHIAVLARYELAKSFASARGVLFLVLYGIIWFWILWKLSEGWATYLASPEGNTIAGWILDATVAKHLFVDNPATLSAFLLLALTLIPVFVLWGAGDQTASDIGSKHLRFLIPRCGRLDIYVGRFVGAVLFIFAFHLIIVAIATAISGATDPNDGAEVFAFGMRAALITLFYALPYVALMSFVGALTGSAPIAVLTAISGYTIVAVIANLAALSWPAAAYLGYLTPAPLKSSLLTGETGDILVGGAALLAYTAVYFAAGWWVIRRRDI